MKNLIVGYILSVSLLVSAEPVSQIKGWGKAIEYNYQEVKEPNASTPVNYTDAISASQPQPQGLQRDPYTLAGKYNKFRTVEYSNRNYLQYKTDQKLLIVSAEGEVASGHAVVILATLDGNVIRIDHATGYYSKSINNKYDASFDLNRVYENIGYCNDCTEHSAPAKSALDAYKNNWRGFFGVLPHALIERILTLSARLQVIPLTSLDYVLLLNDLNKSELKEKVLTNDYLKSDFRNEWIKHFNKICLNTAPIKCLPSKLSEAGIWPQIELPKQMTDAISESLTDDQLQEFSKAVEISPIQIGAGDYQSRISKELMCFKDFKSIQLSSLGRKQYITAYLGKFKDGYAEGLGTLYLNGKCSTAYQNPEKLLRVTANFHRGIPNGSIQLYSERGFLLLDGNVSDGVIEGVSKYFDGYGAETGTANHNKGVISEGQISGADVDYYFHGVNPPTIARVFSGKFVNGAVIGGWDYVPSEYSYLSLENKIIHVVRYSNYQTIEGKDLITSSGIIEKASGGYQFYGLGGYYWPNGSIIEGNWAAGGRLLEGPYRVWDVQEKAWYAATKNEDHFEWKVRVKKKNFLTTSLDFVVDQIDRFGHGSSHFFCNIFGKKENEDCHINGGVAVGSDGVVLTDGSGTPSLKPLTEEINWDVRLEHTATTDMSDLEWRMSNEASFPFFQPYEEKEIFRVPAGELSPVLTAFTPRAYVYGNPTANGAFREDAGGGHYFGAKRKYQVQNEDGSFSEVRRVHTGTDYATKVGDNVYSPIDGVVSVARYGNNPKKIGENWIVIMNSHGERVEISYAHPLQGPVAIKPGTRVVRGSLIGKAGDTSETYGHSVPNHIHVQNYIPGKNNESRGYWVSPDGYIRIGVDPSKPPPPPPPAPVP